MGRESGIPDAKLLALSDYEEDPRFDDRERLSLAYADRITRSDQDVDDTLFNRLSQHFGEEEIVELTATVAFENFLSKFHRALRVEAQGFCPLQIRDTSLAGDEM